MSVSPSPVVSMNVLQSPIVDDKGRVTQTWVKWFQNVAAAVNAGLTNVGTALKLPFPTTSSLGGVQSAFPVAGQFVTGIDAYGVPQLGGVDASQVGGIGTGATISTSASGGAATALPALPSGYLLLTINGTQYKVPVYGV